MILLLFYHYENPKTLTLRPEFSKYLCKNFYIFGFTSVFFEFNIALLVSIIILLNTIINKNIYNNQMIIFNA